MQITVRTHPFRLQPALETTIIERIEATLGRLSSWVSAVDVTVTDVNGPKGGGDDKQCLLRIHSPAFAEIIIEETGADYAPTVTKAAERAKQTLSRKVDKTTAHRVLPDRA